MHIALVLVRYKPFGGYERQAAMLAEALLARGHQVTIVSSRWTGDAKPGLHFHKVPIVRLSSWLKIGSFALFSKAVLQKLGKKIDVTIAFDRSLIMNIYRAGAACHRTWLANRIQTHGLNARISIAVNPLNRVINRVEKSLFCRIEEKKGTIVALSAEGAKQIQAHYDIAPERFVIIPPAVDFTRFKHQDTADFRQKQRQKLGLEEEDRLLLHVGSGFRIKGVDRIIRALPYLMEKTGKVRFIAIGADKKGIRQNRALAQELGVAHRVEFPGGVEAVGEYYAASDCFLLLSMLETFGAVAAEALWFGLPTVIGAGAGAAGMISNERLGRVVEATIEPVGLAQKINECIIADQQARKSAHLSLWQQERRRISAQCDSALVMDRYLELIENYHE